MAKKGSRASSKPWDARLAGKKADELRAEMLRLMRGSRFSTVYTEQLLQVTYDEFMASGTSPADTLQQLRLCFGAPPTGPEVRLRDLAVTAIRTEIPRLEQAPIFVLEPAALADLESDITNQTDNTFPPDDHTDRGDRSVVDDLPESHGYLVLPRPVYTRAIDGTVGAIKALVWGPQAAGFPGDADAGVGIRISVYHEPKTLPHSYRLDGLQEIARDMRPATTVPPLLLQRAELFGGISWQGIIAERAAQAATAPPVKAAAKTDVPPAGAAVFDDKDQTVHLKLLRAFCSYCRQVRLKRVSQQPGSSPRKGEVRQPPDTPVLYLPKRTLVREPVTGSAFTSRGDARRGFTRRTQAWPVDAVTATVIDPATGTPQEKVVRKAHVKGPERGGHTYAELVAQRDLERIRAVTANPSKRRPKSPNS